MSRFMKRLSGAGAVLVLAFTMSLAGATAANAGTCTTYGVNSGNMSPRCMGGSITFSWKCSSDLFGRTNYKTLTYPTTYFSTQTFRACNIGNPRVITNT